MCVCEENGKEVLSKCGVTPDEAWWSGTALWYHWWTQPMPNVISYYVFHLVPKTYPSSILSTNEPINSQTNKRLMRCTLCICATNLFNDAVLAWYSVTIVMCGIHFFIEIAMAVFGFIPISVARLIGR
jgi:hypothetical protein